MYTPTGLNRKIWNIAKNRSPEYKDYYKDLSHTDCIKLVLSEWSGCEFEHIRIGDCVDVVISTLTDYYANVPMLHFELSELFAPLRSDYVSTVMGDKWDSSEASKRIIDTCMSRIRLARVRDGEEIIINLE